MNGVYWEVDEWDEVDEAAAVEPLRHQSRLVKWVVWAAMAVVAMLVILAGWIGWWYLDQVRPTAVEGIDAVPFTVLEGDTVESVAARLEAESLIVDDEVFVWYVEQQGGIELVPGYYEIGTGEHVGDVLARLRTPPDQTYLRVTFPEGYTIEQMGARLAEVQPRLSADAFVAAANSPSIVSALRPGGVSSMEGLLFPDTYQISNADSEAQVVERMTSLMERVAVDQEEIVDGAAAIGRTPYEVLIIASMIEREAKVDEDRAKIARVIYNRLFIGMHLQIDATLYYGQDRSRPFSELVEIDSPYNTYRYAGLPPTPIANPGRASIEAALHPSPNPPAGDPVCQVLPDPTVGCYYLYYVLANEAGGHAFAVTLDQHNANVRAARAAGLL